MVKFQAIITASESSLISPVEQYETLSPDSVLDAIEKSSGLPLTGGLTALNSFENRVYQIEVNQGEVPDAPAFVVAKFNRPNRWTAEQINEEHEFLFDLAANDIAVIPPLKFADGKSLHQLDSGIYYCLFLRVSGRTPAELSPANAQVVGSLIARIHATGKIRQAHHRRILSPTSYGRNNLKYLLANDHIDADCKQAYTDLVNRICDHIDPWFEETPIQRLHGDCHLGNLIERDEGFYLVDFDDMVQGPPVQDLWIISPGHDQHAKAVWQALLQGYETFSDFDYSSLRLIEPLRALRFMHFHAWLAKRFHEPTFQSGFPHFAHPHYWHEQVNDLREIWERI